ncbi:DUF2975 domain-containing protein [Plantactinospora siamensis]|uniref:DUF2975 domain-containing protein n=1 Tax=Plantactinospora siamensis TaxID=555372 RepID=A0ABV6P022_9ACTN
MDLRDRGRLARLVRRLVPGPGRWLAAMELLLLGAVLLAGGHLLAGLVGAARHRDVCVEVSLRELGRLVVNGTLPTGRSVAASTAEVCTWQPSLRQELLDLLARLPGTLVVLVAVVLLLRVVRAARFADPFVPAVAGRLRRIGAVLLLGGCVAEAGQHLGRSALARTLAPGVPARSAAGLLSWLFAAVVVFAIAAVLDRGTALRAELDGVI